MSLRLLTCPFSCIVLASSLAFYFSPVSTYRPRCHPAPLRRHPWHSLAHCHTLYLDLSTLHTPQKKIQIVPSLVRCERHQRTHMNCAVLGCITRRENIEGCNSCSRPPLFCSSARVGQTVEVHILMVPAPHKSTHRTSCASIYRMSANFRYGYHMPSIDIFMAGSSPRF